MDLNKIGNFISECRKEKGYSQVELASRLNISNKTVSKWERGNGFPDVSLLMPLCEELNVSVNELLSGEKLQEEEYHKKAEENLVEVISKARISPQEKAITRMQTIMLVVFALTAIVLESCFKSSPEVMVAIAVLTLANIIGVGAVWCVVTLSLKDLK